ncbi:hypothetical protein IQ241_13150 [Romeria aff. gracilis LEGE 07310]|uniref:2'-5' RNA ligase family protein n=1 Tax=Vasconcelosia minhoensis LEGE 07310 TaxID=915328 RepID=A0A8J7A7B3_9CYAN|nr:hypothetical protein [Romeria gracilis]MBE9078227.1 hypothetical protein [Romeria aff. gracilis LEGE 07310]
MSELILYACPTGELAAQLEDYFRHSRRRCGPNAAHAYMPHCTLTGFFQAESQAIPRYVQALEKATAQVLEQRSEAAYSLRDSNPSVMASARAERLQGRVAIQSLQFHPLWHGLELASDWLCQLAARFARYSPSAPALRLKDWLHLSLAYDFDPAQAPELEQLARAKIDIQAEVRWELRLYERNENRTWHCHRQLAV